MTEISVSPARTEADVDAVRQLCRDFVDDQIERYPSFRDSIRAYFGSAAWEETLRDLPAIHARPGGDMLLALAGGEPAGCIMYFGADAGTAEVKRLFVPVRHRGLGLGKALVQDMLARIAGDGYSHVRLETASFLAEAQGLYQRFGFRPVPDFYDHIPEAARVTRSFAREV